MKHNFSCCSTRRTTLTCCVKRRSLRTSDRDDPSKTSYCHLILGSTDTQTAPTLANFLSNVFSSHLHKLHSMPMFMMLYAGHFITDNTCNNLITNLSKFVNVPCWGQWPVHIADTDFNLVLFSWCTFPALLSMDPV